MNINKREVFRYLGYQNHEPDEKTDRLVDDVIRELEQHLSTKNIQRRFQITILENDDIVFRDKECSFQMVSKNLTTNLRGCEEVVIFAATLGNGPDQLMNRYEISNMTKAAISQSASAMLIEAYCDQIQEEIRVQEESKGHYLRPRFSPGYGDLSIIDQKKIFQVLECEKRIGLTLTDSFMMLPIKSVTAIIGITKESSNCHVGKCKQCNKKDCEFRNE